MNRKRIMKSLEILAMETNSITLLNTQMTYIQISAVTSLHSAKTFYSPRNTSI